MDRVTMQDIAQRAGVSRSTVSHVLNNREPFVHQISPEVRARIQQLAAEMNYIPDALASGLGAKQVRVIGLFLHDAWGSGAPSPAAWLEGNLLSAVSEQADRLGLSISVHVQRDEEPEKHLASLRRLAGLAQGGLIVRSPHPASHQLLRHLHARGIPNVVVFPSTLDDPPPLTVDADNAAGGRLAAQRCLELGKRRVVWIHTADEPASEATRLVGFRDAWRQSGESLSNIHVLRLAGRQEAEDSHQARQFLEKIRPTAVVGAHAPAAVAALRASGDLGLHFPQDIILIGFDCDAWGEPGLLQISSIQTSWFDAARIAFDLLVEARAGHGGHPPERHVSLKPRLEPGDTCGSGFPIEADQSVRVSRRGAEPDETPASPDVKPVERPTRRNAWEPEVDASPTQLVISRFGPRRPRF
jgi:DNA-binding LacI/PurR family transcriptional regulator